MKIVDGKCPYCSHSISEKPGLAPKQINCESCGRLLNLPSKNASKQLKPSANLKTFEIALLFTFLISLTYFYQYKMLMLLLMALGASIQLILYRKDDLPGVPGFLRERVQGTAERMKIFPFEFYSVFLWVLILLLVLINKYQLAGVTLCMTLTLTALMSIQANRLFRESKMASSKVNVFDFKLFYLIMKDPSSAFDKRKADSGSEAIGYEHFEHAAAVKEEQDIEDARNTEVLIKRRQECMQERKQWEEDIQQRYNQWLDDEYDRLVQEISSRN